MSMRRIGGREFCCLVESYTGMDSSIVLTQCLLFNWCVCLFDIDTLASKFDRRIIWCPLTLHIVEFYFSLVSSPHGTKWLCMIPVLNGAMLLRIFGYLIIQALVYLNWNQLVMLAVRVLNHLNVWMLLGSAAVLSQYWTSKHLEKWKGMPTAEQWGMETVIKKMRNGDGYSFALFLHILYS